jgi:hypothetical protein
MLQQTHKAPAETQRQPRQWGITALAGGALLLIVLALVAIPLLGRRPVEFAPITTPEGVVQRFFDATYRGDYAAAYAMLSETTQKEQSLAEFQEQSRYRNDSEMRVDNVAMHTDTATVTVTLTYFSPGGLFGGGEWTTEYDVLLEQDGDTWRIVGMPLW